MEREEVKRDGTQGWVRKLVEKALEEIKKKKKGKQVACHSDGDKLQLVQTVDVHGSLSTVTTALEATASPTPTPPSVPLAPTVPRAATWPRPVPREPWQPAKATVTRQTVSSASRGLTVCLRAPRMVSGFQESNRPLFLTYECVGLLHRVMSLALSTISACIIFIAATSTMLSHSRGCHILLVGSQCVQSRSPVKLSASVALWAGTPQTPCCIILGHHILSVVDSLRSVM